MKELKTLFLLMVLACGLFTAWLFIPFPPTIDKQTFELPLTEPFKLVTYRSNPNDASKPFTYHYYVISNAVTIDDMEPFLITTDQFVKLGEFDQNTFKLTVNG